MYMEVISIDGDFIFMHSSIKKIKLITIEHNVTNRIGKA